VALTVEEILAGTGMGSMQSVGQMQVIPVLGDDDDSLAPPDLTVSTSNYGTVELRNDEDRPTVVPTGAGWVTRQMAQDHAVGGASFISAKGSRKIDTAMCIQQSQGGLIRGSKGEMLVLPLALRAKALSVRNKRGYDKLWTSITDFNKSLGVDSGYGGGHLEYFLKAFKKELDEFVAEFEIVPRQVGAIVLVGGAVVGVERAPSAAFWEVVWEPLIRVCYGSLAIKAAKENPSGPPTTRVPFTTKATTVQGLLKALHKTEVKEEVIVQQVLDTVRSLALQASKSEEKMGNLQLTTLACPQLAGQIVVEKNTVRYASLCANP
jgi:hypothetical protein